MSMGGRVSTREFSLCIDCRGSMCMDVDSIMG